MQMVAGGDPDKKDAIDGYKLWELEAGELLNRKRKKKL